MCSCFHGHKDRPVQNFRSKELSVFALFNVGQVDAGHLIKLVETLDPQYKRTVDVKAFGQLFCGPFVDCYTFVFEKFFRLMVKKSFDYTPKEAHEAGTDKDNASLGEMSSIQLGSEEASHTPSIDLIQSSGVAYHHFLSFLLFFMCIPDFDLVLLLYWLSFPAHDVTPDHSNMEALIDQLWPPDTPKLDKLKAKAQSLLVVYELVDLRANSMRMTDVKAGGVWSKPLLALREFIIKTSRLGKGFWKRVGKTVHHSCLDMESCYGGLKDPYRLSQWGKHNFALTGDRKAARKDVRVVVRLVLKYVHMPLDKDDDDKQGAKLAEMASVAGQSSMKDSSLLGHDGSHSMSVEGVEGGEEGAESRIDKVIRYGAMPFNLVHSVGKRLTQKRPEGNEGRKRGGVGMFRGVQVQVAVQEEIVPLDVQYAAMIVAPLEQVYVRVLDAQTRARLKLQKADEEVEYSAFNDQQSIDDDMGSVTEEVKRRIVVDVSSSEGSHSPRQEVEVEDEGSMGSGSGSEYSDEEQSSRKPIQLKSAMKRA